MNDAVTKKGESFSSHFDIVRKIETMCGEIPFAIKQFKSQVSEFGSMDKKLTSMKSKTERRASAKKLDRLEAFISEYQSAYRKCCQSYASILKALDEIDALYTRLTDHYSSEGKRKEANRALSNGEKFDKNARKQLTAIYDRLESSTEIAFAKAAKEDSQASEEELKGKAKFEMNREDFREDESDDLREEAYEDEREDGREGAARQRRENNARRGRQNQNPRNFSQYQPYNNGAPHQPPYNPPYNAPQYSPYGMPYYPPSPYGMPPVYTQPSMTGLSIAPISIDVNSAVDSVFESFMKAFDERAREYAANYEFPEAVRPDVSAESEALNKAVADESFVVEKLSELFEKINGMLNSLSELTAKYSELEEKNRLLAETMKAATDTNRSLSRELQGIQATQKVIGVDQLKLAEEQAVIVESQSVTLARQEELRNAESAVASEFTAFLDGASTMLETFKKSLEEQSEITNAITEAQEASEKLLELQKNLGERQSELSELQREAILAQKKITRSQKAVNERLGAKTSVKKEKNESEKAASTEDAETETAPEAVTEAMEEIPVKAADSEAASL